MSSERNYSVAVSLLTAAIMIYVIAPVAIILLYAFSPTAYFSLPPSGATLRWFHSFLENDRMRQALLDSTTISLIATPVAILVALPTAVMAVRHAFPGRELFIGLIASPLLIPGVISGIAFLSFFSQSHLDVGYWSIVVAMTCFTLPFALRPLMANLAGLDPDIEKAARNLGASPLRAFLHVTLPQLKPGLIAAGIFVFVESFDNFSIAVFLTNLRTTTLPVEVYSYILDFDDPTVAAIATLLIVASVGIVFLVERVLGLDRFLELK